MLSHEFIVRHKSFQIKRANEKRKKTDTQERKEIDREIYSMKERKRNKRERECV